MDTEIGYAPRVAQPLWERQSWLGAATLESVVEVNEQVLALLRERRLPVRLLRWRTAHLSARHLAVSDIVDRLVHQSG